MSTCISREGEYNNHVFNDESYNEFTCARCWVFDEDAALAEVKKARGKVEWLATRMADLTLGINDQLGPEIIRQKAEAWDSAAKLIEDEGLADGGVAEHLRANNPYRPQEDQ